MPFVQKSALQFALLIWLAALLTSPAAASIVTLTPSGSLSFDSPFYGDPGSYATIRGSGTGSATFVLNSTVSGNHPQIAIDLYLTIGPDSTSGSKLQHRDYDFEPLTVGWTYGVPPTTLSAAAYAFIADKTTVVPV
jgi:hypothetical protein